MNLIEILKQGGNITQSILGNIDKNKTAEEIKNIVCSLLNINPLCLVMRTRRREIADARHIYCYLMRRETTLSLKAIGVTINRTHDAVLFGVRKIRELKNNNKEIGDVLNAIDKLI